MLPDIRKIYTAEAPDGMSGMYVEGSKVKAVHTTGGSWYAPDVFYISSGQFLAYKMDSGNLSAPQRATTGRTPITVNSPGEYTIKSGNQKPDGEVDGVIYLYDSAGSPRGSTTMNSRYNFPGIMLRPGDTIEIAPTSGTITRFWIQKISP